MYFVVRDLRFHGVHISIQMASPYLSCLLVFFLLLLLRAAEPAPSNSFVLWNDECNHDNSVLELCQMCATKSKSRIVYPMCCEAREEARTWCQSYLSYGLHDPGYH